MLRWRRLVAAWVLGVVVVPWLPPALAVLHLDAHGRDPDVHHERDFEAEARVAFHGHYHQPGTPEHHHFFLIGAGHATLPTAFELAPLPPAILRDAVAAVAACARRPEAVSGVGHDPPWQSRAVSVLRI